MRRQNEREWRRFSILPETTAEIEFNLGENYCCTRFEDEKWRHEPFRIDNPLLKKRDEVR
jgi:hypothetical protein